MEGVVTLSFPGCSFLCDEINLIQDGSLCPSPGSFAGLSVVIVTEENRTAYYFKKHIC